MVSLVGVTLAVMHVIETNLIRLSFHGAVTEDGCTSVTRRSTLLIVMGVACVGIVDHIKKFLEICYC